MGFDTVTGRSGYVGLKAIPHVEGESLEKKHKRMIDIGVEDAIAQAKHDQMMYKSWLKAQKVKSGLKTKEAIVIRALKNSKGKIVFTEEQRYQIKNFKSQTITEECPACEGEGYFDGLTLCGSEVCTQCKGKKVFSYDTILKIETLTRDEFLQLEFSNLKDKKQIDAFLKSNPKLSTFTGNEKDWLNIPKDINAISVDSKGLIEFYSGVSGIYSRYDDAHSNSKKYDGGQYWYFGSSLPGLNITKKHKNFNLVIGKLESQEKIFYRPSIKRTVLDFSKPFDWRMFPDACTKLFITFGGMDIKSHGVEIEVGSKNIFLRDDNVVWGENGRNNVDEEFKIDLCREWINDGTNSYPIRKEAGFKGSSAKKGFNEMNLELRNIPLETVVYELPKDRSKPIAISELKKSDKEKCAKINKNIRPINDWLTISKYPFKYPEGPKHEIEYWLLSNTKGLKGYVITDDLKIDIDGNIRVQKDNENKIKYKFGIVTGEFTLLADSYSSLENLPDSCKTLLISHSKKMIDVTVFNTVVTSGILKLQFLDNLKTIGKLHKSINKIQHAYLENIKKIIFHKDCARLKIEHKYKD